jgi:hypothetical protein
MPRILGFPGPLLPALLWPWACFLYFYLSYRSPGYLAGGLAVLVAFHGVFAAWDRIRSTPLGLLVLAVPALALPALGLWQTWQLQDLGDSDHAIYVCAFWNLLRGVTRYSIHDLDIFGSHANYTCVLWLPAYLAGGAYALKVGKALCLLAAVALVLGHLRKDAREASWGGAALLLSPAVASQFFFGFHPEILAAPLLVLLFHAYREERLGRFLLLTALLAYTKEVMTLAVGGLLLVALMERRSLRWILLPGLLCCLQMALYWFVIKPHFSGGSNHLTERYMPTSLDQVLDSWLRIQTLQYVLHATFPFLPLLLALPKRYLALPIPLMAFYAAFPDPLFMVQWTNYNFPVALMMAAGLILSPGLRIGGKPASPGGSRDSGDAKVLDGRILLSCAVLSLLSYPLWREPFSIPSGNGAKRQALSDFKSRIPYTAAVLLHGPISVHFAGRKEVQQWVWRNRPWEDFDFVILETALPYWTRLPDSLARDVERLSSSPLWSREYSKDGLHFFRRLGPGDAAESPPKLAPGP